jgi:aspartate/methionine/tyrosine aminotransferase
MLPCMQAPSVDLFDWLLRHTLNARYNFAFSNIQGITVEEYHKLTDFSFPPDFDLGSNQQYGAPALKEALQMIYKCTVENIVTTTGASEANFLVFSSHLSKGDDFIIEQPGYQPLWLTPEMLGARRINWPRLFDNNFRVDIEALKNLWTKQTKLVILSNLHNPSGIYTDDATIKAVAEIAGDQSAYVLVDEIYLDGSFTKKPSCFGLPNVLVTSSATKVYGLGGLHTGWVIAPEEIAARCQRMKAHTTGASSYTSELMTAYLLKNARENVVKRFLKQATTNHAVVKEWMARHSDLLQWVEPDGGLVCFPKYSPAIPSVVLCKHLFETQNIVVNPGSFFNAEGFIRLSFGCDSEMLQDGLAALANGLQNISHIHSP